jgi:hypothetical protein
LRAAYLDPNVDQNVCTHRCSKKAQAMLTASAWQRLAGALLVVALLWVAVAWALI